MAAVAAGEQTRFLLSLLLFTIIIIIAISNCVISGLFLLRFVYALCVVYAEKNVME